MSLSNMRQYIYIPSRIKSYRILPQCITYYSRNLYDIFQNFNC